MHCQEKLKEHIRSQFEIKIMAISHDMGGQRDLPALSLKCIPSETSVPTLDVQAVRVFHLNGWI